MEGTLAGVPIRKSPDLTSSVGDKKDNQGLTGIEIVGHTHTVKVFYVIPSTSVTTGGVVLQGAQMGTAQDLGNKYPGITNHVHVEMKDVKGRPVDPTGNVIAKPLK